MKNWIIGILAGLLVLLVSAYIFIPNVITFKANTGVKATAKGIHRMLLDKNNITRWWPGKIVDDSFYMDELVFKINAGNMTVMPVSVTGDNTNLTTSLYIISIITDSTQLEWVGSMVSSYNPVKRLLAYRKARKINNNMNIVLNKMKTFFSVPENIYGFEIKKELVADSFLIVTSGKTKGYPTNGYIYSMIDKLSAYAASHSTKESGYPMLNVGTTDSMYYDVKVAIPTEKALPDSGDIVQKRMLGRGNILVTEVTGGIGITTKAIEQIQIYAHEYQRSAPAIPFFSLITDRTKEPDSSKWITKIYCPVM